MEKNMEETFHYNYPQYSDELAPLSVDNNAWIR